MIPAERTILAAERFAVHWIKGELQRASQYLSDLQEFLGVAAKVFNDHPMDQLVEITANGLAPANMFISYEPS